MNPKEDYKQDTTRILCLNGVELRRHTERRRVYRDKQGNRLIHSYDRWYPLNDNNEWRQETNDCFWPDRNRRNP